MKPLSRSERRTFDSRFAPVVLAVKGVGIDPHEVPGPKGKGG